jgi:hypothetical protein
MNRLRLPSQTFRLKHGYRVTFHYDHGLRVEWEPCVPKFSSRSAFRKFLLSYTAVRDAFLQDVAQVTGGNIMVVDMDDRGISGVNCVSPQLVH